MGRDLRYDDWHQRDTLDEALWYAVSAFSDEYGYSTVLVVASPQYAEQVERRLVDSEQLDHDVVDEEPT